MLIKSQEKSQTTQTWAKKERQIRGNIYQLDNNVIKYV
jgi:hypothetical protein